MPSLPPKVAALFPSASDPAKAILTRLYHHIVKYDNSRDDDCYSMFEELALTDTDFYCATRWCDKVASLAQAEYLRRKGVKPPKELLVGVETNPGPSPVSKSLGKLGSQLAIALAKTKKKKKGKKPKQNFRLQTGAIVTTRAPLTVGSGLRNSVFHSPFIVRGTCIAGGIGWKTTATRTELYNADLTAADNNRFSIDPYGTGTLPTNFKMFPNAVLNVASSFTRYRVRKLFLTYNPLVSATTPGHVVFATNAEVSVSTTPPSYGDVVNNPGAVVTPIWQPATLDLMINCRREWLYGDLATNGTEANIRQESCGSFLASSLGYSTNGLFGTFTLDFEIEFQDLSINSVFNVFQQRSHFQSSSTPVASEPEEETGLAESVHLPADLLQRIGLRRA